MHLRVKVAPNARKDERAGWEEDPRFGRLLRVRLKAAPVDGKANRALERFLATELGVPKSRVCVVKGATSRVKTVEIPGECRLP